MKKIQISNKPSVLIMNTCKVGIDIAIKGQIKNRVLVFKGQIKNHVLVLQKTACVKTIAFVLIV